MTAACTLSGLLSFFQCAELGFPFGESILLVVFVVFFLALKVYPLREALPASLFITLMTALLFSTLGLISSAITVAILCALVLSVIFLMNQNDS